MSYLGWKSKEYPRIGNFDVCPMCGEWLRQKGEDEHGYQWVEFSCTNSKCYLNRIILDPERYVDLIKRTKGVDFENENEFWESIGLSKEELQ